jgi:hypothetical protein
LLAARAFFALATAITRNMTPFPRNTAFACSPFRTGISAATKERTLTAANNQTATLARFILCPSIGRLPNDYVVSAISCISRNTVSIKKRSIPAVNLCWFNKIRPEPVDVKRFIWFSGDSRPSGAGFQIRSARGAWRSGSTWSRDIKVLPGLCLLVFIVGREDTANPVPQRDRVSVARSPLRGAGFRPARAAELC